MEHRTWPEIRYINLWLWDRILHQSRGTVVHCMPIHEVIVYTKHSFIRCNYLIHDWFVHNVLGSAGVSQSAQGLSIAWLRWRHSWRQHNVVWLGIDAHVLKSSNHSTHAELVQGSLITISVVLHAYTYTCGVEYVEFGVMSMALSTSTVASQRGMEWRCTEGGESLWDLRRENCRVLH